MCVILIFVRVLSLSKVQGDCVFLNRPGEKLKEELKLWDSSRRSGYLETL